MLLFKISAMDSTLMGVVKQFFSSFLLPQIMLSVDCFTVQSCDLRTCSDDISCDKLWVWLVCDLWWSDEIQSYSEMMYTILHYPLISNNKVLIRKWGRINWQEQHLINMNGTSLIFIRHCASDSRISMV